MLVEELAHAPLVQLEARVLKAEVLGDARPRAPQVLGAVDVPLGDIVSGLDVVPGRPREARREGLALHLVAPLHAPVQVARVVHAQARVRPRRVLLDEAERRLRLTPAPAVAAAEVEPPHVARVVPERDLARAQRALFRRQKLVARLNPPEEVDDDHARRRPDGGNEENGRELREQK
jgi:hypothetical protein